MPDQANNPCTSHPFMLMGDANKAPVLDYHIPQKSCLPIYSVRPNVGKDEWFKRADFEKPQEVVIKEPITALKKIILQELQSGSTKFTQGSGLLKKCSKPVVVYDSTSSLNSGTRYMSDKDGWVRLVSTFGDKRELDFGFTSFPSKIRGVVPVEITGISGKLTYKDEYIKKEINTLKVPKSLAIELDLHVLTQKVKEGYIIKFVRRYGGMVSVHYLSPPRPARPPVPRMYLKFVKELCSVTGNYGAGETVDTLSLLPGERRTISIRTYEHSAYSRSRSKNVIDSMGESSVHSFENAVQQSNSSSFTNSNSFTETDPGEVVSVGTPWLMDLVMGSADATFQSPSTATATQSHLNQTSSTINSAVEQQVNESNHFRNVSINSSTTQEVQEGEESLIVREIANINQSRTLNFVFRRLLQHYHTFLVLKDIRFGIVFWRNGKFHTKEVSIDRLESLIQEFVLPNQQLEAMQTLIGQTAFVYNYDDKQFQVFKCEEYERPAIACTCNDFSIPAETVCRWVKVKNEDTYEDFTIDGIILNHSEHVLKTSSLLADAFLGQGEALDCYNTKLQEENIKGIILNNTRTQQAIQIIEEFGTAQEKADNYKKIYGECCDEENE